MPKGYSKKFKLFSLFKSPFSRRGKKKTLKDQEGGIQAFSSYEDFSTTAVEAEPLPNSTNTEATSTTRGSRSSFDANASPQGPNLPLTGLELGSIDGRCQSPAPSQARSNHHSVSKVMSGENFSTSIDFIKQQVCDSIRCLVEYKESVQPSTDDPRYHDAVGSLEGAARGLEMLRSKLGIRKYGGNPSRNSYTLPLPDLKVHIEDTPFSITIPEISESQKASSTLEAVQESKETGA